MTKQCTKCGETKALEFFYRFKRAKDGRTTACKVCLNNSYTDKRKLYYSNNREYLKKKMIENRLEKHDEYKEKERIATSARYKTYTPAVYLATFKEGTYVGESKVVENRNRFHRLGRSNVNDGSLTFVKYEILEQVEDTKLRKERELYWINKLKPTLNQSLTVDT